MGRARKSKGGGKTTPSATPPAVPLKPKPRGAAAITPAEASPPDPPPAAPPEGIPPDLWEYCLFGQRISERAKRDNLGVKKAALAQLQDEPKFKKYRRLTATTAHNIATRLKPEDWERLGRIRLPQGRILTTSHLRELTLNKDRGLIEKLLTGLEHEGWTTEEIRHKARAFKEKAIGAEVKRGGRPRAEPKTLEGGLEALARHAEDWLKDYGPAARGRSAWLDLPVADAGPDAVLDRLVHAKDLLRHLAKAARELEARVNDLEVKVRGGGEGTVL